MTSKVIILLCGLVALASAGTLRPGDRKQWKAAQESQGSFEIRQSTEWEKQPETWSKSDQNNEKEIDESTTVKSVPLATRTFFGYGDSIPIQEESMENPKEQMRNTQIYESQPTVQWYHRQPTFSWEYKNSDNNNDGSISYKSVTIAEPEKAEEQQEDEQQSKQAYMNIEEKKTESAAEAAALHRAQYESNDSAFHHHHHHHHYQRYENNYHQEKQQEIIEQAQYVNERPIRTEEIQDTKKSDSEEEVQQIEAETTAKVHTEIKPIVVLEQQAEPIIKSYTQYEKLDQPQEEKWSPANYEFRYEVNDKETGDVKHHEEKAIEGKITGEYGLLDADGMIRIVKYTADDENGFLADVTREERREKKIEAVYEPKW